MNRPVPPHMSSSARKPAGASVVAGSRTRQRVAQERTRSRVIKERIRIAVRGVGEILITLGLVLLLFCGYQLWWTDVTANAATDKASDQLSQLFADAPVVTGPIPELATPADGEPFARMFVPRFGDTWVKPIIQGVDMTDLHKGVGHYPKTALPGEIGNFAVAGHRTTNGKPFRKVDQLEIGDKIFVETRDAWYTYVVYTTRLIVEPRSGYYVVSPSGTKDTTKRPTKKIMTLTSCHPPFSAAQRMITQAELTDVRGKGQEPPPGLPVDAV